ncbi:hypothetical protein SY88_00080 [Clostridiales bacterium PH28_bin88]|nr:hypothetical protein SY88_00080 [Clostridiales bacterium PH28_bin88]
MMLPFPRGRAQPQFSKNYPAVISTLGMVTKGRLWLEGEIPAGGPERTVVDRPFFWSGTIVTDSPGIEGFLLGKGEQKVTIRFIAEPNQLITLTNCSLELEGTGQIRFTAPSPRRELVGDEVFQAVETYFRHLQERVYKNIVVVFGAGASRDYFPTSEELLQKLLTYDGLRELVERFFLVKSDTPNQLWPTLSEVLGFIDIACEREEYLGKYFSVEKLRQIKTEVLDHLCQVFVDHSQKLNEANHYYALVSKLLKMVGNGNLGRVDFISLNYDNLLDHALKRVVGEKKINYCIEIKDWGRTGESPQPNGGYQITPKGQIRVVKFHGSIDWMCCPNCQSLYHVDTARGLSRAIKCHCDGTALKWFLYPPKREKYPMPEHNDVWSRLHSFADNLLREADKVIGYSLSEDDAYFRFRLKKNLHRENKPADIVVVDAPRGYEMGLTRVEKNHWHFLGPVDYRPVGFEEFAEEPY